MSAIIVNNLSKYFKVPKNRRKGRMKSKSQQKFDGLIHAVDNISFKVKKGEIFGFLGPNGAGKTTSIRMMTGVLKPTKGNIVIFGSDVWKNQIEVKQVVGNVPEMANVYMSYSGWENLMLIGELYGISKAKRINNAKNLLKKFDLYEKRKVKTGKYSKGMKQRLLICMALMSDPEILFLDEPTSGLDVQSAKIIKKLIQEYNQRGVTIFLTTHNLEVANELCDRIAIINQGKLISLDTPNNLKKLTQEYQAVDIQFEGEIGKDIFNNLQSAKEVQIVNGSYHIIVEDTHQAIYDLINLVKSNNLTLKQLSTHQPKLEEAFLKIIGGGIKNE